MKLEQAKSKKKVTIVVSKPKEPLMTNFEESEGELVVNNRLKVLKSQNLMEEVVKVSPKSSSFEEEPGLGRNSKTGGNSPQTRRKADRVTEIMQERSENRSPTRNSSGKAEQLIMKLAKQLEEGEDQNPQVSTLGLLKKQTLQEKEYSNTPANRMRRSSIGPQPSDQPEMKLTESQNQNIEEEEGLNEQQSPRGFGSFAKESIKRIEESEKEGRTPPGREISMAEQLMFEGGTTPASSVGKRILAEKKGLRPQEVDSDEEAEAPEAGNNIGSSQLLRSSSLKEKGQDTLRSAGKILIPKNDPQQMKSLRDFFDFKTQIRYSSEIMFLILMLMIDTVLTNVGFMADPTYHETPTSTFRLFFLVEILALLLVIYSGVAQKSILAFKISILCMFLARLTLDQVEIFSRRHADDGKLQLL
jgi:hypothetical protein